MTYPPPPHHPVPPAYHPAHALAHRHKQQAVAVPLIFLVLGGLATLLGMLVFLERPLTQSLVAVATFTVVLAIGVWFLHWLDRWEPEPHFAELSRSHPSSCWVPSCGAPGSPR